MGEPLDPDVDLQEADILTYNYVKKFENVGPSSLFISFSSGSPHACPCWWLPGGFLGSRVGGCWFLLDAGFYILLSWRSFPHSPAARHGGIPAFEIFTGIAKPHQNPQSRILPLEWVPVVGTAVTRHCRAGDRVLVLVL